MKLFLSFLMSFSLGIFAEEPFDQAVKKIDLRLEDEEIAVVCLPLANGEAMLMKNAAGQTVLVNTGGKGSEKQVRTWLERLYIGRIDTILLTDVHHDFASSFALYRRRYHAQRVIAGVKTEGVTSVWKDGEHHALFPHLFADVLAADGGRLTIRFRYGRLCLLYMASDDESVKHKLMNMDLKDVDVLKVAQFARSDHLSASLLKRIDPQVAIIFHKQGVQPNQRLLEKLYQRWIDIYQVHQTGIVMLKCDLSRYEAITL
ncbi:beta-lactamase superfamily II metal-dependent hydrolase [Anoxybacillus tepidamans]|uniref:Beta-lactamase superfamily II metal-dependent hydrolase n=1 Tax=Anoxybacteroides tepidamans TaxID=265948 RepID=A0A7W8MV56_9BACL|nr:hypothetical protein [Anoxybacillus tepidamans]MBB5323370.1 beta-lactamase superfamily II metal-dependent hydrolase [Anoxybacillus tepidamans]